MSAARGGRPASHPAAVAPARRGPGQPRPGAPGPRPDPPAVTARDVALVALERVDGGAYANLVLPPLLRRSG